MLNAKFWSYSQPACWETSLEIVYRCPHLIYLKVHWSSNAVPRLPLQQPFLLIICWNICWLSRISHTFSKNQWFCWLSWISSLCVISTIRMMTVFCPSILFILIDNETTSWLFNRKIFVTTIDVQLRHLCNLSVVIQKSPLIVLLIRSGMMIIYFFALSTLCTYVCIFILYCTLYIFFSPK